MMMAAVLAEGETVLENAAREPEVVDLADLLTKMGANVQGAGSSTIRIRGVDRLHGAEHTIIADRIEAGTFLIGGAITGGDLRIEDCVPEHLSALISKLRQAGAVVDEQGATALRVKAGRRLDSVDVTTEEHPGFATDLQAQMMALMTIAEGAATLNETIFENRFMHVPELLRMGADIRIKGSVAVVRSLDGIPNLFDSRILQDIADCARLDGGKHVLVIPKLGEDHDLNFRHFVLQLTGCGDAIEPWHLDVHQDNLRLQDMGFGNGLFAIWHRRN